MIPIKYKPEIRPGEEGRVKRNYQEPSDQLVEAFEEYLERIDSEGPKFFNYSTIVDETLEELEPKIKRISEVNALPLFYPKRSDEFGRVMGNFLTAVYNLSEQESIVYEIETDYNLSLGSNLAADKSLFLESDTKSSGYFSKGTIINSASVNLNFCLGNRGLCVNDGRVGDFVKNNRGVAINLRTVESIGAGQPGSLLINFGDFENFWTSQFEGTILSYQEFGERVSKQPSIRSNDNTCRLLGPECIEGDKELMSYLNELESGLTGSFEEIYDFLKSMGDNPAEEIEANIKELIGDSD